MTFDDWLAASDQEILDRWYTTGLTHRDPDTRLHAMRTDCIGVRLAQATLALDCQGGAGRFWTSYPFHTHDLHSYQREERLRIFNAALGCSEFGSWVRSHAHEDHKRMALMAWERIVRELNDPGKWWGHRTKNAEWPHLTAWIGELVIEQAQEKRQNVNLVLKAWAAGCPGNEETQRAAERVRADWRRQSLERGLADGAVCTPPSKPRVF